MTRTWARRLLKSVLAVFIGAFAGSHIFLFLAKLAWHPFSKSSMISTLISPAMSMKQPL